VAPGVLWMRLPLPMALDHVNVYALDDGDGWTMVDTGLTAAAAARSGRRCWPGRWRGGRWRVVITHHHPDHIGLAGWFRRRGRSF
jgi:glyoxylase-like metal-dependent hydrolase (beta-lactamase superfamily II)